MASILHDGLYGNFADETGPCAHCGDTTERHGHLCLECWPDPHFCDTFICAACILARSPAELACSRSVMVERW